MAKPSIARTHWFLRFLVYIFAVAGLLYVALFSHTLMQAWIVPDLTELMIRVVASVALFVLGLANLVAGRDE